MIITTPVTGGPFGPGFEIQLQNDFVGPLEPGAYWELFLTAPANETIIAHMFIPDALHGLRYVMVNQDAGLQIPAIAVPEAVTGEPGQLQVILQQPTFGPAETEEIAIVLDREAGQVQELMGLLQQQISTIVSGLTVEEHDAVVATNAAVVTTMGIPSQSPPFGIAELLVHPPLLFGGLSTPPYVLEGDGEIPDLHGVGHAKFGIYWLATTIPAGLSHTHGQTEEYTNRLVQFRTTHVVGGVEMVTEVFDAHFHGGLWVWERPLPTAIDYSVLPGVVVQAQWWQVPA